MSAIAAVLVALVTLLHAWFLVLEMFLWQQPLGLRTFHLTAPDARTTAPLAATQALYNVFPAAGLLLPFVASPPPAFDARVFLLPCATTAGAYGAATVSRRILLVQSLPAVLALIAVIA